MAASAMDYVTFRRDGKEIEQSGRLLLTARDGGMLLQSRDGMLWRISPEEQIKHRTDDKPFEPLIALSRAYFNARGADFSEIPCELPDETSLGGLVLRACRKIPYGQTRSYHVLAELIARPDAARAVAGALGKNNIPLVVPCHRVTYADGRLGGFSAPGGTDLKQRMLDLERKKTQGAER